mmetsp:Transcript_35453/g.80552  ORF Transcript_35453/g.80552 Transcript_35453/m.80552 type:complete len:563 (-) Transcript_35453:61-1749(-)
MVGLRVARAQVPVALQSADGAVDARVALNGHHVTGGGVHEIQSELASEVHGLAQALVELQHLLVALVAALAVDQARGCRLEELEAGQGPLVEHREAAVLGVLEHLLDHVGHLLGGVPRAEVLLLPLLVLDRQEQDLGARLRVVDRGLHDVLLPAVGGALAPEELQAVLEALHGRGLGACQVGLDEHLVEGVLVVELVADRPVEGEDAHVRGQALAEVGVGRALDRRGARDDQVDALLRHDGLDGRLPGHRVDRGPGQDVVLGDVAAEARVAVLVGHDLRGEDLVAVAADRAGDRRGLGHLAARDQDPQLLLGLARLEGRAEELVAQPSRPGDEHQHRRATPQQRDRCQSPGACLQAVHQGPPGRGNCAAARGRLGGGLRLLSAAPLQAVRGQTLNLVLLRQSDGHRGHRHARQPHLAQLHGVCRALRLAGHAVQQATCHVHADHLCEQLHAIEALQQNEASALQKAINQDLPVERARVGVCRLGADDDGGRLLARGTPCLQEGLRVAPNGEDLDLLGLRTRAACCSTAQVPSRELLLLGAFGGADLLQEGKHICMCSRHSKL